jgi:hypothetical protein
VETEFLARGFPGWADPKDAGMEKMSNDAMTKVQGMTNKQQGLVQNHAFQTIRPKPYNLASRAKCCHFSAMKQVEKTGQQGVAGRVRVLNFCSATLRM